MLTFLVNWSKTDMVDPYLHSKFHTTPVQQVVPPVLLVVSLAPPIPQMAPIATAAPPVR